MAYNASVLLDFLDDVAKLILTNALLNRVTTVVLASIYRKALDANALQDMQELIVKKNNQTAEMILAQKELCARMSQVLIIIRASVDPVIPESIAILR